MFTHFTFVCACNIFLDRSNQEHHNIIITHFFSTEKGKKSVAYLLAIGHHICDEENSSFFALIFAIGFCGAI